eukprot:gnl/TRDRNA2_/TRDRNA2_94446_c1_seq1.p1 gnl/TRDRNA2_/TRDRNA2_94446_c1~~gnl/TRDRNA2_/TRDRNA2_94446_c1_seq1.p1  ORF type:complete len:215 (-),score=47.69 gnl/TRDRNA2_/TRDRNA2_94446_c1_seq1:115-681(-)
MAEPLRIAGYGYYSLFLFYIAFLTFAVLNVLTGIFVDTAMSASTEDNENVGAEDHADLRVIETVEHMCAEAGFGASEALSLANFKKIIKTHEMHQYMRHFELSEEMTEHIYVQLSGNGATMVPLHFFLSVCGKMKGAAKSADMLLVLYPLMQLHEKMAVYMKTANKQMKDLQQQVNAGTASRSLSGRV